MIEIVLEENGILSVDLGDVFLGRVDLAGGAMFASCSHLGDP